jgi:hypothetical protein
MPIRVSTFGIELPDDFPKGPYEAIHAQVNSGPRDANVDCHYRGAWNAVANRFLSCTEHDAAFNESVRRAGNAPGHLERYIQDNSLFGFFVTGLSVIESFFFGLHAIAAMTGSSNFPMQSDAQLRQVTPESTISRFETAFPADPILVSFESIRTKSGEGKSVNAPPYEEWREVRNVLAHRSAPGRIITPTNVPGSQIPDVWRLKDLAIDESLTASRRQWLTGTLADLLAATERFVLTRL